MIDVRNPTDDQIKDKEIILSQASTMSNSSSFIFLDANIMSQAVSPYQGVLSNNIKYEDQAFDINENQVNNTVKNKKKISLLY